MAPRSAPPPARGRPALPPGEALTERRVVRMTAEDASVLAQLAAALGVSEAEALRAAMRAHAARKVR